MVADVGVAHFFQLLFGQSGTAAGFAVEVDGGVFVGSRCGNFIGNWVVRDIDCVGKVAYLILFWRAHVYPDARCFGRLDGRGRVCGGGVNGGGEHGCGKQRGQDLFFHDISFCLTVRRSGFVKLCFGFAETQPCCETSFWLRRNSASFGNFVLAAQKLNFR